MNFGRVHRSASLPSNRKRLSCSAICKMTLLACFAVVSRRQLFPSSTTKRNVSFMVARAFSSSIRTHRHIRYDTNFSPQRQQAAAFALNGKTFCPSFVASSTCSSSTLSSITTLRATTLSSADDKTSALQAAMETTHPSFEVLQKDVVDEYGAYCTLYRHKRSGAELLSVANEDDNKVFGITFRTPPSDSTGVPHILEHSVLCGSRKYKTKDPFVQLLQGSLQTFLNAFTYPDRTCYVVASQNTKDFYNLINVYTDAVFYPRAVSDPNVHAQEGWHYELENPEDELTYKGVVYNEMKGVYSSPDSLLTRECQRSLFPDTTYGVDSGGDPRVIPNLSFEQFREFHQKFYHPANSRIYFAGDDDVIKRLEIMDEYLNDFEDNHSRSESMIQWQQKKFTEPKHEKHPYPVSANGTDGEAPPSTHMMCVNWLLNDKPLTSKEEIVITILDHLLMGTSSSTLRKALIESNLGEAITGGGLSDELLQATFSVGLKGVKGSDKVKEVEQLIYSTLERVANEGFTDDAIAASMNTIEFQLREFNTGSFPKGLAFMLGSMSKWLYDNSPTEALKFEEPLADLKKDIAANGSQVFKDAINTFLLQNTHRSIVEMLPSETFEEELLKEEKQRLASVKANLKQEEILKIIESTSMLKELQAAEDLPEAMATIPKLHLGDLKREVTEYPIEVISPSENDFGVTIVKHELVSTSGIAYVDFGVDLSLLDLETEVPLLPLFSKLMKEAGAGEYDDVALSRRIGTYTGGIDLSLLSSVLHPEGVDQSECLSGDHMMTKLFFRGKATSDKTGELFSIMKLMLTEPRLDSQSKALEMLRESKARLEANIVGAGHQYVNTRLRSRYDPAGYIQEKMGGISYLNTVKQLLQQAEEDWPTLLKRLETIRVKILDESTCRNGIVLNLTGDEHVFSAIDPYIKSFLMDLPGAAKGKQLQNFYMDVHPWIAQAKEHMKSQQVIDEGFVVPTQVSYVGKAGKLYEVGEKISGSSAVVSRYLKTGYLWDYVRVIGGAYGGFCTFSPDVGYFSYLSYRDPNLSKTIDVYDNASSELIKSAEDLAQNPEALETAIIGAVGDMDSALGPDQKGWISLQRWLSGETPEQRQKWRDEVLATTAEDFKEFAQRLEAMKQCSTAAVVSSKSAFETASKEGKQMKLVEVL